MSRLERLQKDVADAEVAYDAAYKDYRFHLGSNAAWEASMVASSKAKKALDDYLEESWRMNKLERLKKDVADAEEALSVAYVEARDAKKALGDYLWQENHPLLFLRKEQGE